MQISFTNSSKKRKARAKDGDNHAYRDRGSDNGAHGTAWNIHPAVMTEMREELSELRKGQKVVFKLLLPLLLTARDGKTNGELKEALHLYNEYMQEK